MAVKGKGKQIAGKDPASSSGKGKRKSAAAEAESSGAAGRKKKRNGVLQFFDDAAVDAELDEEEDDWDDDDLDLEEEEIDLDFGNEQYKQEKGGGKANPLPFFVKEEELSGDELETLIRDRYGRGSEFVVYDEDKEYDDIVAAEHSLKDATIWRVKCMFGRERQITFSLMQKFIDLQEFKTKLGIISVFALEHIKGYVFIEADKASDVVEACRGFCNVYTSRIGLVPRNEIPHLLIVRNKVCEVSKDTWVRMKNGKYKGDLGQVVAVDEARKRATIKMIPRIDLGAIAKKYGGGVSLKHSAVPAQRLISSHELGHFRPHIEIRRDRQTGEVFEVLDGLMFKDGYLYKKMAIASLVHWGVQPTEHELLKFTDTSKDEDGDLDWLSSVYEGRKRMKSTEASSSNGATKEGDGYDLHELVLFGRKGFGVIISLGKDGIQILKGDTEGQVVVNVKSHEIKKGCDDKMFTASDCNMKTISINDLVKVSEGPVEGRQGIVRHMYKGTLFLYDENQEDNSGIFCAKSSICENIRPSRGSFGKSGKKSSSSFSQSSMTSCDQEDNSRTFGRYSQRESEQTFSIGQTLRIKKGPLKGYLCRVVGVYRKNVTVKLDSLVKLITVEEQFLSVPNIRSDGSAAVPIGGLSDEGRDQPLGQSSWDTGRDSWQALTSSSFPFASNNDQKSDQGQGDADPWGGSKLTTMGEADPWGSKASLASKDQGQGNTDSWGGSKLTTVAEAESADPWGSKVPLASESADPWGSKVSLASRDQEQGAADPWGNKGPGVSKDQGQGNADPWGSSKLATVAEGQGQQAESADPWGSKVSLASTEKGKGVADPWGSKVSLASADKEQGAADPWGSKGAVTSKDHEQGDAWGTKAVFGDSSNKTTDNWGKTGDAEQSSPWNKVVTGVKPQDESLGKDTAGWNTPSVKNTSGTDGWGDVKQPSVGDGDTWGGKNNVSNADSGGTWDMKGKGVVDNSVAWDKPSESGKKNTNEIGQWGKSLGDSDEKKTTDAIGWDAAAECLTKSTVEQGGKASSWDTVRTQTSSKADQWGSGTSNATGSEDWSKPGFSIQSQKGEWNETKSFGSDQVSSWNKVDNEEAGGNQRNEWNKSGNSGGGRGFGRGRGRNTWNDTSGDQEGKWNKPMNCEGDGGSSTWGSGGNRNDGGAVSQDQENSWSNQRDFQGGRAFGRGRGRGRYGGSGNRDDYQARSYESGGDWGSGRGRGRGRNGDAGSFSNNFDDTGSFSRGGGRGRGRGRFESSDWKNNQENFGDGGFSKKSTTSWGNDDSGSWDKSKGSGNIDQQGGWTGGKSAFQGQSSDWNTPKAYGDNQTSSWNQASSTPDKQSSGWASAEGKNWDAPKKSASGSQFSAWENKSADNEGAGKEACGTGGGWDSAKQFDGKKDTTDGNEASGAGGNWDRAKPVGANPSSDWNSSEKKGWSATKSLGEAPIFAGNASGDVAAGGDSWSKAKPSLPGKHPADTRIENDGRASGDDPSGWNQNSSAREGNWSRPKTLSGGNQSSDWGKDEGHNWTKPNSFGGNQSSSWSDRSGGDQPGGWGRGGNDQSFGGRGNSFSGRGRGRGRNPGGGRWNGGRGGNQEGNGGGDQPESFSSFGGGQSSSWNKEGFTSGSGWSKGNESNAGGTDGKGPRESWKSDSGKQPGGGWGEPTASADGSGKSGGGGWDQPKSSGKQPGGWGEPPAAAADGSGKNGGGGWDQAKNTGSNSGGGWNEKNTDKDADGTGGGHGGSWGNPKSGSGGKGGW